MHGIRALAVVGAAATLLLLTGWYLQRPDAFTRVWLPAASALAGVALDAESGRVTWSGRVRAQDLRADAGAFEAAIASLDLDVEPLSLLPGRRLAFEHLRVSDARLVVDATTPRQPPAARESASDGAADESTDWSLPRVAEAQLENVLLRVLTDDGEWRIGPSRLTARDVGSSAGRIDLATAVLRSTDGVTRQRARVDLSLRLAPLGDAVDPAGHRIESLSAKLFHQERQLADLELSGRARVPSRFTLDGRIASQHPDALAALLGFTSERFTASALEGTLALRRAIGDPLAVEPKLALRGLRSPRAPALPQELQLGGTLRFDDGRLELDPVVLRPQIGSEGGDALLRASGHLDVGAGSGSEVALVAEGLPLAPWLRAYGVRVAPDEALVTNAELTFRAGESDAGSELAGKFTTTVSGPEGTPSELLLRPTLRFGDPALSGTLELEGPGAQPGQRGDATLELALDTEMEPSALSVDAQIADFDLTPLRGLIETGGEEVQERRELALLADLRLDSVRLVDLLVEDAQLHVDRAPGHLLLRLQPMQLAGGRASFDYERSSDESERVELALSVHEIDLSALLDALGVSTGDRIRGLLTLETRASGEAPAGSDPVAHADGHLEFALADGSVVRTRAQRMLAARTALEELLGVHFAGAAGEYPVEDGRVVVDELRLDGRAVHLVLNGSVGMDRLELRINPRVGPDLASRLPIDLVRGLVGTVLGQFAIPLVLSVQGPYGQLHYGLRPATPSLLADLFGGVTGLVRWVSPGGDGSTREDAAAAPIVRPPPGGAAPRDGGPSS